jgi:hypothetical protein
MPTEKMSTVFERMKARLQKGWVQGVLFRNNNGKHCAGKKATGCCILGALLLETDTTISDLLYGKLQPFLNILYEVNGNRILSTWQDNIHIKNHDALITKPIPAPKPIIALLNRAIKLTTNQESEICY